MAKKKTRSKRTKTSAAKAKSSSKSVSKKRATKVATKARAKTAPKKKRAAKVKTKATPKKKRATKARAKTAPKKKRAIKVKTKPARAKSAKAGAKAAPKKKRAVKVASVPRPPRRDATGHLDPQYARELRERSLENRPDEDEDRTFFSQPRSDDDLAEELGEEAVATMTSGEDQTDRLQEAEVEEEQGGPFVTTNESEEFAQGTDKSNPVDATREPFPRT